MPRYFYMLHTRLDPIAYGALRKLAEAWDVRNDRGDYNLSETVRRAIVYAYLTYIEGVDPTRASNEVEEYIEQKLVEIGLLTPKELRRLRKGRLKKLRKKLSQRAVEELMRYAIP